LNPIDEQHSPGPFGTNLKNVNINKFSLISRGNQVEFKAKAFDGPYKDLEIQALEVLVQNPTTNMAEKVLVFWLISRPERVVFSVEC